VCPVKDGAVDRCVDSSRYFVLRVENAEGRHMFIGMAFNERNDAFDFNTSLEDARREKEAEANPPTFEPQISKDYSLKDGDKIHIPLNKVKKGKSASKRGSANNAATSAAGSGGFKLKPSKKDTQRRGSGGGGML
jgi:hypothetical protein